MENHLKKQFLQNLPLKLLSFSLAMVVWFYVNFIVSPEVERTVVIPLKAINQTPATWLGDLPEFCTITVQAPRRDIAATLYGDSVFAHINLVSAVPNMNNRVPVVLNLPANLPVIHQSPKYVEVTPRVLKSLELPVELRTRGEVKQGYYVRKVTVSPARVIVTAPDYLLTDRLLCTLEVDLSGRADDLNRALPVFVEQRQKFPGFSVDVQEVTVRILVNPWPAREVPVRPVLTGEVALGFEINAVTPVPEKIYVKGVPEVVGPVKDVPTVMIDVGGLKTGISQQVDLDTQTLPGLFLETKRVMVTVAVEQIISTREFQNIRPVILSPATWEVSLVPDKLDVILVGPQRLLATISKSGPALQVDCQNVVSSEVELPLRFAPELSLPGVELRPAMVKAKIRRPQPVTPPSPDPVSNEP